MSIINSASPLQPLVVSNTQRSTQFSGRETTPAHAPATWRVYGGMLETKAAEDLCMRLEMSFQDVADLRQLFAKADVASTNHVTQAQFFQLVGETRRPLTRLLLRIVHVPATQPRVTFDEFLRSVCTMASFTETELLQCLFDTYAHTLGSSTTDESFRKHLGATNTISNLSFEEFASSMRSNKLALDPILLLQRRVRQRMLGEAYWLHKARRRMKLEAILTFMRANHGRLPRLPWSERLFYAIFRKPTKTMRLHDAARGLYSKPASLIAPLPSQARRRSFV